MNVPMIGNGWGRTLASKRAPEDGGDADAYGSSDEGYGLSEKLSGAVFWTSSSTMLTYIELSCDAVWLWSEVRGVMRRDIGACDT
jgi:hypothetical protein